MEKIQLNNTVIMVREEEFGCTIFDGNVSIQVNETFYTILSLLAMGKSVEEIKSILMEKYNIVHEVKISNDIQYVCDYIEKMRW